MLLIQHITPTALLGCTVLDKYRMTERQRERSKAIAKKEVPKYKSVIEELQSVDSEENHRIVEALRKDFQKLNLFVA